ncbi:DoxX family protein [Streptomyces agglomeratus]|uniref:DoxX family protein n=1 Tax=Streptomyces agglomeratus TaxID=285458 RepID=A0A1E5PFQ1_9ACTN|nr:DoxX family protein [Streptomyces agglomeratus]OEJ28362.1 DoxX family protein [Streptomyces agglomeratus]OEJ37571.1 DoxX family protein [Streptomyces agglomeratus]OEJ48043.1 DoxX family protein [Streptomyces agglomeratus]OEJ50111.1 DoxX family protein [Streptomyces agglomeratus]OEJ57438.1 DoxX family protein [Streptomyces agglomeratus]
MNVALWIVQALLALAFGLAGLMKSTQPREKLIGMMPWAQDVSTGTLRLIGVTEFLAALGLILPAVTGVAVWLTPLAACGLALIMVLAAVLHLRRKENSAIVVNVFLLALAVLVAWGRFGPYSL